MTNEERQQLQDLVDFKKSLENSWSIPLTVDQAFKARFASSLVTSTKSSTSENQTVSEAGGGTYPVMGPPDGFLKIVFSGVDYYIPYFL